tara:strand:+ start:431 stop:571 length:141 start_codon:yes stop_codon:yes gene_type:complete
MREKVHEYLKKPSKKGLAGLTTMEQKWVKAQEGDVPKAVDSKKVKP